MFYYSGHGIGQALLCQDGSSVASVELSRLLQVSRCRSLAVWFGRALGLGFVIGLGLGWVCDRVKVEVKVRVKIGSRVPGTSAELSRLVQVSWCTL